MAKNTRKSNQNIDRPNRANAVKNLSAKQKRKVASRRMYLAIGIVLSVVAILVGIQIYQKFSTLSKLKSQEAQLKDEYKKELQISKELKEKKKFVQTDDYVEDMARKLGLLYPDEVILQPEK